MEVRGTAEGPDVRGRGRAMPDQGGAGGTWEPGRTRRTAGLRGPMCCWAESTDEKESRSVTEPAELTQRNWTAYLEEEGMGGREGPSVTKEI